MDNDSAEKSIHDGFIQFGKMMTRASMLVEGVVFSVDEVKFTCVVTVNTSNADGSETATKINKVPLKVLQGAQASLIEIPKVGSNCLVCFRDNNIQRCQLFSTDQSDKILVKIGNTTLQADINGWVFNGGSLGGLIKIDSNVTKLNNLENDINALKTAFSSWVVVATDGGAALKAITATWFAQQLTPTVKADLENTKIKQ